MKKQNSNKNKIQALAQILILIFGIIAISWAVGSEVREVSGQEEDEKLKELEDKMNEAKQKFLDTDEGSEAEEAAFDEFLKAEKAYKAYLEANPGTEEVNNPKDPNNNNGITEPVTPEEEPIYTLEYFVDADNDGKQNESEKTETKKVFEKGGEGISKAISVAGIPLAITSTFEGYKALPERLRKITSGSTTGAQQAIDVSKKTVEELSKLSAKEIRSLSGEAKTEFTKKLGEEGVKKLSKAQTRALGGKLPWYKVPVFGKGLSTQGILTTAAIAFATAEAYVLVFKLAGAGVRNLRDLQNAAIATTVGVTVAATIASATVGIPAWMAAGAGTLLAGGPAGWAIAAAVVIAMAIYTLTSYKQYSQEIFTYIPTAWKAPEGGEFCDNCNNLEYGCSEYQCKSFGQACEIVNKGTEQEKCVWKDPKDISSPVIKPLNKTLPLNDYEYEPLVFEPGTGLQGVKIKYTGVNKDAKNCLLPYTSLVLGVETDELAECKIDVQRTPDFESMLGNMAEGSALIKEHTLPIPHAATASAESQEAAGIAKTEIKNGEAQEFFIRCKDANGNENKGEFIMQFCVQDGPDTSAPQIIGTNFLEKSYLQYNQTSAYLEVYTDEPAECRWSFEDLAYNSLQFNFSKCSMLEGDYLYPEFFQYGCLGTINGLKDKFENKIYIKCKDKPWWADGMAGQRYANQESFKLTLLGTEPLVMDEILVNGKSSGAIIKDSTDTVAVKIEAKAKFGADNGKSKCQYESAGNFIDFYNNGEIGFVNVNTQNFYLEEGAYNVLIKCYDIGGNFDNSSISFTIDTDREAPIVVRTYYDTNNLRITTNEEAECVYTTDANIGCSYVFEDGQKMTTIGKISHYTSWEPNKIYYMKCKDIYENKPTPQDQCSIVVRAFEDYKK